MTLDQPISSSGNLHFQTPCSLSNCLLPKNGLEKKEELVTFTLGRKRRQQGSTSQGRSVLDVFQEHEGEQYCDTSVDKGMRQVVIGLVYRFLHEQCMCKAFMEKKSKTFKYTQKKN